MVLPHSPTTLTHQKRIGELTDSGARGRYIDFGVRIIVVRKDAAGIVRPGTALPRVVKVGSPTYLGGRWDTLLGKFVGPCEVWPTWCVGEKQYEILFGDNRKQHNLLYSAEGAGKTMLMAMWLWVQILLAAAAGIGGTIGATAPTAKRLGTFIKAVQELAPVGTSREPLEGQWGSLRVDDGDIAIITGKHAIQFRSTMQQSAATGAPIQGWNWGLGVGCDELQDSIHAFADIMARLRSGLNAPCMATATAKDSPVWRSFRDGLSEKYWQIHRLSYLDAWAIHDSHWEMLKANTSDREWQRRGLALDVGPEKMTYPQWVRAENLRPVPAVGAIDVTEQVLAQYGANNRILVGHDPGNACDVSVLLKAYQLPKERRHRWWIVGEVTTKRDTTETHIIALKQKLHAFGCDPDRDYGRPHIRIDPTADPATYTQFRAANLSIRPANYKPSSNRAMTIPKESRIDVVCRLLCNANGERWLMVAADDRGRPSAEKTVESIELSERDAAYEAEKVRKGDDDITHWTTALGYALWALERPRIDDGEARGRVNS